jgi:hypothetical protein
MRRTFSVFLGMAAALVGAGGAQAATKVVTQTVSGGAVTATYTYTQKSDKYGFLTFSHQTLQISRGGQVLYSKPVTAPECDSGCAPLDNLGGPGQSNSVHVLDLDASGEPEVLVDLYTGGAHCCAIAEVFAYSAATNAYALTSKDFGDPAWEIQNIGPGGQPLFVSADDYFAYAFTDYADSGLPIQIWSFGSGRFQDVTRSYPTLIAKDAAMWWKAFRHNYANGEGLIAAWAADEELLGKNAVVQSALKRQARLGHLRGGFSSHGKKFVRDLNKFLRRRGYIR